MWSALVGASVKCSSWQITTGVFVWGAGPHRILYTDLIQCFWWTWIRFYDQNCLGFTPDFLWLIWLNYHWFTEFPHGSFFLAKMTISQLAANCPQMWGDRTEARRSSTELVRWAHSYTDSFKRSHAANMLLHESVQPHRKHLIPVIISTFTWSLAVWNEFK